MRIIVVSLILVVFTGCTTASLRQHTLNQSMSISDMRYAEVLDDFAILASNPGILPSYALLASGTANVTQTYGVDAMTTWDHAVLGFSRQLLNFTFRQNPDQNWTLDPVVSEPQLKALSAAFLWVLQGPPPLESPYMDILREVRWGESGYHFDVAWRLEQLPQRWLHVGSRRDVPRNACYTARCGKTSVWVMPDGLEALSEFTLVVLDIATADLKSLVWQPRLAKVDVYAFDIADKDSVTTETWFACQDPPAIDNCCVIHAAQIHLQRPASSPIPPLGMGICVQPCPSCAPHTRDVRPESIQPNVAPIPGMVPTPFQAPAVPQQQSFR